MVPGSTLMYGSSLTIATLRPRASSIARSEAEAIPLPREDTTPPVTNTKRVISFGLEDFPPYEGRALPRTSGQRRRANRLAHLKRLASLESAAPPDRAPSGPRSAHS